MTTDIDYSCDECGQPAPALDSLEILDWEGGEKAHFLGERDPLMLSLVCPGCVKQRGWRAPEE